MLVNGFFFDNEPLVDLNEGVIAVTHLIDVDKEVFELATGLQEQGLCIFFLFEGI